MEEKKKMEMELSDDELNEAAGGISLTNDGNGGKSAKKLLALKKNSIKNKGSAKMALRKNSLKKSKKLGAKLQDDD